MTFFSLVAIVLFFVWLYKYLSPPRRLKKLGDRLPGPKAWPVVGNSFLFLKDNHFLRISIGLMKAHGPVTRVWLGKDLFVFLADAKDLEVFLNSSKHLNKTQTYRMLDAWLGTKGLLTGDEDVWRPHRKLLTPSFHFKILESSLEIMQSNATILQEILRNKIDGEEFDILPYVEKCSLDVISETAMGVKLNTQKSDNPAYLRAVKSMTTILVKRAASPWLFNEYIFRLTAIGRTFYKEVKEIKGIVRQIIQGRKRSLESAKSFVPEDGETGRKRARPFLDYMLLESNFTDDEIENEVQTFMFAGHDTTMTTVAFCMYSLSQHPDVQDKVYQEIQNVLGKDNKQELTYQDYNNELRYLDCVIKETLRRYTTVPIVSRQVAEDLPLPSGHTLPKGTWANFFLYRLHNDERYFPNPDLYIPERFEKKEDIVNFSFIPFSAGLRNCIGQRFAMLEMKVIISALIRKYRFLPSEKVQSVVVETGVVLRSLDKTPVRITLREPIAQ